MMSRLYEYQAIEQYKEFLDDVYPGITLAGSSFYASTILQDCDPTAFRIGLDEWITQEVEEGNIKVEGYEEYEPEEEDDDE